MELYKRHRPKNLQEIVGNRETVTTLQSMVESKNLPHTFLLTGNTGTGKTTLARIIAKEVGSKGFDIKEINSADFRGIDTVRSVISNSQFAPVESKAIVWILDELHTMGNIQQTALLKILEDTPKSVYFVLCTTNGEKLLKAIRSRCSTFNMNNLDEDESIELLKQVCKKEKEKIDNEVLKTIAKSAAGRPRETIQILEQVIATPKKQRLKMASKIVSVENQAIDLARVLIKQGAGWKEVREILKGLKEVEPETVRRVVLGYCTAVLLNKDNERVGLVMENFIEPYYDSGFNALLLSCYTIIKN